MLYQSVPKCSVPLVLLACLAVSPAKAAELDFEGLAAGEVIRTLSTGAGINGAFSGTVEVTGFNPSIGAATNAAIVFDSACPGGVCSGNDFDLGTANENFGGPGIDNDGNPNTGGNLGSNFENAIGHGNVAIVAEDLVDSSPNDGLVDDPDDADLDGQYIEFRFDLKGNKTVTIDSVTYLDNDEGEFNAQIEMYGPGIPNQFIALPAVGDNGINTIDGIGVEGVRILRVVLNGSGAVVSVVFNEDLPRPCWVTLGGFQNAKVQSGPKQCTFGGNVGPPASGALEVNFHDGPLDGWKFHTNDIHSVQCYDSGSTGPQQPGGKKGLEVDTLEFDCTGRLNNEDGYTCSGYFRDAGEPQGKKGNGFDEINVQIRDEYSEVVAECVGELDGGNIQIHPPVGN